VIAWATTIYSYQAQGETELSFGEGEVIGILEEREDGWSYGDLNGSLGLFPTSYAQKTDGTRDESSVDYSVDPSKSVGSTKDQDPEEAQRRRERRQKLKDELKDMREQLVQQAKTRERLEKELTVLTETKQKLKTELRQNKAKMSDKGSLLFDLIKLSVAMDVYTDAIQDVQTPQATTFDALSMFASDLTKEAKSSPALNPFAQKISAKMKDLKVYVDACNSLDDDADKHAKDFHPELDRLVKTLEKRGMSKD